MGSVRFTILPPPNILKNDIECFRIAHYSGNDSLAIKVCPNGYPGIVFQFHQGKSAIKNIVTDIGSLENVPLLFLYGQVTNLSVMNFHSGPYTTIQVILKPHALKTLFGVEDASTLTNNIMDSFQLGAEKLTKQLLKATNDQDRIKLFTDFLLTKRSAKNTGDELIEKSVQLVQKKINSVTVESLLKKLHISERQFEKRFIQTIGISPILYIRLRRFNEAMKLMDMGRFERLSDVAYALNFYDQSHFIRDIKEFSGITPKSISQKVNDLHRDQVGSSYLYL